MNPDLTPTGQAGRMGGKQPKADLTIPFLLLSCRVNTEIVPLMLSTVAGTKLARSAGKIKAH